MAINFGILKLISYSYCKSHCTTIYGFTVLLLKKIILSSRRHPSLSNVTVDLGKKAVVFNDVTCEQLSRVHKNRTTSKIAHETVLQYRLRP